GARELGCLVEKEDSAARACRRPRADLPAASPDERGRGRRVVRRLERWAHDKRVADRETAERADRAHLESRRRVEIRQQPWQPRSEHRLPRARWPEEERVVAA